MPPTILVIEDDPKSVRLAELMLGGEGYQTVIASNGLQGLKVARTDPPDLILLDLMLPGLDGFEVLNRLRADPQTAGVPVVVVSAKAQSTDRQTATKIGANAYLTKPYRRAELLDVVGSLLSEREEETRARGTCVVLVGARGGEEAPVAAHLGLALTSKGQPATVVDFRPFSIEHSLLLDISPRSDPSSLSDPDTARQLAGSMVQHASGLRLLDNLEGGGDAGQLTAEDVQRVLEPLLAEEGTVLADVPLYPVQVLRRAADYGALVLLVTRSDRASLMTARTALMSMERAGVEKDRTNILLVGSMPEEGLPGLDQEIAGSIPVEIEPDDPALHALAERVQALT
jgi:CheY-like chemotaxis protein